MHTPPYITVVGNVVRIHLSQAWKAMEVEVIYDLANLPIEQNSNSIAEKKSKIYFLDVKQSSGILHLSVAPANYQFNRIVAYPEDEN